MYTAPAQTKGTANTMILLRTPLVAALAATAALAGGTPAAGASTAPPDYFSIPTAFAGFQGMPIGALSIPVNLPAAPCVTSTNEGQGRTGGNATQACVGAGLSFVGPSSAISTVIGPTIITAAFVGTSIVSGGNTAVGP
jgi:hypothetical protein